MNIPISEEKKFRVLDLISQSPRISQRELATSTGFSLGLINLIIRRLAETGHIKFSNLSKRRVSYILTKKGAIEKTRQSYSYLTNTIQTFLTYQDRLKDIAHEFTDKGLDRFAILGRGEIAELMELSLKGASKPLSYRIIESDTDLQDGEVLLDCRLKSEPGTVGVSILKQLIEANPNGKKPQMENSK